MALEVKQSPPRARSLSVTGALLLGLVPTLALFGAAELALRLFAPGIVTGARALAKGLPIHLVIFRSPGDAESFQMVVNPHEADDALGWRNQRNLGHRLYRTNAKGIFSPTEIAYERDATSYRLLVLGDSATAGMGLESFEQAWPRVLEKRAGGALEVINAATIGYSSEQARRFLDAEGWRYEPDGLAIYLGNNDAVASSMTDRALLAELQNPPRGWAVRASNWLVDRSATCAVLKGAITWIDAMIRGNDPIASQLSTRRVSLSEFRENVLHMIEEASERNVDFYLITPPTPLEHPPSVGEYNGRIRYEPGFANRSACLGEDTDPAQLLPAMVETEVTRRRYPSFDLIGQYADLALDCFRGRHDEQRALYAAAVENDPTAAVLLNNLGYLVYEDGGPDAAQPLFLRAMEADSTVAAYAYNAGMTARRLGDEEAAVADLDRAGELDPSATKIGPAYLTLLREIASDRPGVVLVDANRIFREGQNESLFSDRIHPNPAGQELVASLMLRATRAAATEPASSRELRRTPPLQSARSEGMTGWREALRPGR
jgi:lysophospholipase L1-like esterase